MNGNDHDDAFDQLLLDAALEAVVNADGSLEEDWSLSEADVRAFLQQQKAGDEVLTSSKAPIGSERPTKGVDSIVVKSGAATLSPSVVATSVQAERPSGPLVPKPTRKRRRRQKEELEYLRTTVADMERERRQLKSQDIARGALATSVAKALQLEGQEDGGGGDDADGTRVPMSVSAVMPSLWEQEAASAKADTHRAMVENIKLRWALESHINMAKNLESLLQKRPCFVAPAQWPSISTGFSSTQGEPEDQDDKVFESIGTSLDAQFLETDRLIALSVLLQQNPHQTTGVAMHVDEADMSLSYEQVQVIPFMWQACSSAIWQILSQQALQLSSIVFVGRDVTNDTIQGKIIDTHPLGPGRSDDTVKIAHLVMKRFLGEDRDVLVWETRVKTTGAVSVCVRSKVWLIFRSPLPSNEDEHVYEKNTTLTTETSRWEVYLRVYPEISGDWNNSDLRTGTLTQLVMSSCDHTIGILKDAVIRMLVGDMDLASVPLH